MDNVNTTSDATSLASTANFLLSLGAGNAVDSNNPDTQLFADFLSQNQNAVQNQNEANAQAATNSSTQTSTQAAAPIPTPTSTQTVPTVSSQPAGNVSTSSQTITPTLKKLATVWHAVVETLQKLQKQPKPASFATTATASKTASQVKSQTNDASDGNSGNSTSNATALPIPAPSLMAGAATTATTATAATTASTPSLIANVPADASTTATTGGADPSLNFQNPKTLADILAELQILAQLIAQQLQATSTGRGNTATAATASTTGTAAATSDTTTGTSSATSGDLTLPSDPDLLSALNAFTSSLQGLTAAPTDAAPANTTDASTANTAHSDTVATSIAPSPVQALDNLLALAQAVSKQLDATQNDAAITPATASITAANVEQTTAATLTAANTPVNLKLQSLIDALKTDTSTTTTTKNSRAAQQENDPQSLASATTTSLAAAGNTTPLSASTFKNTEVSTDAAINIFGSATPTNANAPPAGFGPSPYGAGLTDSGVGKDGAFDLGKDSQGNNTFSASAQNAASDANGLSSAMESSSSASSPYSFASQLATTKATGPGLTGLPPAVEQVMLQLNRNAKSGNDQMTLQLNPTDLGRVSIKLSIATDGKVQGTVVANNPATLDMLQKDSRSLERALQDAGLRADSGSLQFSLGGKSGNSPGQSAHNSLPSPGGATTQNVAADTVATTDQTETYYVTPGRVNLRV